ncbi:hypothetical protein DPMN_157139 [Dreissena polymorpha]|nr:hypothetical protein DPMN_157139 [Dreissena polymorpha]
MMNGMVSHMCGDPNGKKGCIDEFGAQICTCTDDKCNAPNFNATSSGGYGNSGNSWGSGFNSGGSGSMNGQQGSGSNTWGSWGNGNNGGSGSGWENWGGNQGNEWGKQFSGGNGKDGFHKCENGTNCYNASTTGRFVSLNLVCCAIYIAMWF